MTTGLEPYTNTYLDVDGSVADAPDLINEYHRVAEFLNRFASSLDQVAIRVRRTEFIFLESRTIDIDPADGLLQRLIIDADVSRVNINFVRREEGEPYRVFLVLRFQDRNTEFTVSGPGGDSSKFGFNRVIPYDPNERNTNTIYQPSQREADGHYAAVVQATYGTSNGAVIQVFSDNEEDEIVGTEDTQSTVAI